MSIIVENADVALELTKELLQRGAEAVEIINEDGQPYEVAELDEVQSLNTSPRMN